MRSAQRFCSPQDGVRLPSKAQINTKMKIKCKLCSKEYSQHGMGTHMWRTHGDGTQHKPRLGAKAWNNGLTKETDQRVADYSTNMAGKCLGIGSTPEKEKARRAKLSVAAHKNGLGGHTSKIQIWFEKKDGSSVYLQSSYEVAFAKLLEECNIIWSRPGSLQWIDQNGKSHRYYPDFQIGNVFVDTKNSYLIVKDTDKINRVREQNNVVIHVVSIDNITADFVISTFT